MDVYEIKNNATIVNRKGNKDGYVKIDLKNYNWLLEQAEMVSELKEELESKSQRIANQYKLLQKYGNGLEKIVKHSDISTQGEIAKATLENE